MTLYGNSRLLIDAFPSFLPVQETSRQVYTFDLFIFVLSCGNYFNVSQCKVVNQPVGTVAAWYFSLHGDDCSTPQCSTLVYCTLSLPKPARLTIRGSTPPSHSNLPYLYISPVLSLKGTVSRELRHRLLYIIQKLFSRPVVASLKILILLKGQFAMYIKQFSVS